MTFSTFEKKVDKLRTNNPDLVNTYEDKFRDNLDDCVHDMYYIFSKLPSSKSIEDPIGIIQRALQYAINSNVNILDAMGTIIMQASTSNERGTLQQYFNEISRVYDKHNNNYNIEYCEENRDKLIEMNLKTVISIAKG